ncbi:Aminopeptidase N [Planctomycetes bacterium Poly30]|uniref:Aminopeptidase N n=1 Tax=Saltatorellus ferox TaxID=2528018 RepID=A0A518ELL5_9BACT|nr:Aminopeptidase N [Planctomycetes bacterium Poly30]
MTVTTSDTASAPQPKYRKDYQAPGFWIHEVELWFDLGADGTTVRSSIRFERNAAVTEPGSPLVLMGEELETLRVSVDGKELGASGWSATATELTVRDLPGDSFTLETEVRIHPESNTALSGLYRSSGNFCTQCEAEGFRRITWFLDRPDVMATYRVTVTADKTKYPMLLSNGNRIEEREEEGGRHSVVWEDPFKKPSYLFALVAGDLHCHRGTFETMTGRTIDLEIYVEHKDADKCDHALGSLQRSMKWDEETFGLEYDLDLYMIVAVSDFNMGAMENKGLNVFNSKYVLARTDTASDADFEAVEAVIAHEYFHNWTGNRVTCRDWFQLTLKEGLTVYRDARFTADKTSEAVKRIDDVQGLRAHQFAEDSGPMAHPIRPEQYIEMNNFYTSTVYEKGAEVIRMYETLLGRDGFRKGMDLYFERHDGQAVTCDDFRAAMADANGRDLDQFERWYLQKGTPTLKAVGCYDEPNQTYTLELTQSAPENEPHFEPTHMPVSFGLVGPTGADMGLAFEGEDASKAPTNRVLELREMTQTWTFHGVCARPVPSVLRGFSAPVNLEMERSQEDLAFLFAHDSDSFNRWDAGQTLFKGVLLALADRAAKGEALTLDPAVVEAVRNLLNDESLDGSLKSQAMSLPGFSVLSQARTHVNPAALIEARDFVIETLSRELRGDLLAQRKAARPTGAYRADKESIHGRRLANAALGLLSATGEDDIIEMAEEQFAAADNMTDSQAALGCLVQIPGSHRTQALQAFYERWSGDALVMDKWFAIQAMSRPFDVAAYELLRAHKNFTMENPNRVRSLVGVFAMQNFRGFHAQDGSGYRAVADAVLELDSLNPQVASRMVRALNPWKQFAAPWSDLMKAQLERIREKKGLSKDVFEIVSSALG